MSQNESPYRTQATLGRMRSHSLDSGAPLMPPSLISTELLTGDTEDSEDIYNTGQMQEDQSSPTNIKTKIFRENYHCRRYDGNVEIRVRAQVMLRDDSTGGWLPMGGGGLANVSVKKRKIHHSDFYDQPCRHEYLIQGKRISDDMVVLNCSIKRDFVYNKVMPTFHHWKTGNKKYGLTFQTAADAKAFHKGIRAAIQDLLDAKSLACPHKHYRDQKRKEIFGPELLRQNCIEGDDDVFMQLVLPVLGGEPQSNSRPGSRSPSECPEDANQITTSRCGQCEFDEIQSVDVKLETVQIINEQLENSKLASDLRDEFPYVKFYRQESAHDYAHANFVEKEIKIKSASSSFKKQHIEIRKSNSGGSVKGRLSRAIVGSGSSLCSSSNNESSQSGSHESKRTQVMIQTTSTKKPLLPEEIKNQLPCSGSPSKMSLTATTPVATLTCTHCRETFNLEENRVCSQAPPDCWMNVIETATCFMCARCLLYHCATDTTELVNPCTCSNHDGHRVKRWIGLSLLSILMPCVCCYLPIVACYKCCSICGSRHQAQ